MQFKYLISKLDNAKFGLFHVKAILVAGVGFFTVSFKLNTKRI